MKRTSEKKSLASRKDAKNAEENRKQGENKATEAIADCESRNAEWEDRWTNKEEAKQEGELNS